MQSQVLEMHYGFPAEQRASSMDWEERGSLRINALKKTNQCDFIVSSGALKTMQLEHPDMEEGDA